MAVANSAPLPIGRFHGDVLAKGHLVASRVDTCGAAVVVVVTGAGAVVDVVVLVGAGAGAVVVVVVVVVVVTANRPPRGFRWSASAFATDVTVSSPNPITIAANRRIRRSSARRVTG
jgi:hypothetical protein